VDRQKTKNVFVVPVRAEETVHSTVECGGRGVSAIVTIPMTDNLFTRLLVIHRRTIGSTPWEEGWRNGEKCVLKQNDSSYEIYDISDDFLQAVFIERVKEVRTKIKLPTAMIVLSSENCLSQLSEDTLRRLARAETR
jgi:hypothetical protein